ncbi:MAG: hypothetical protein ABW153_00595, partial [Sedimenticola sp.]
MYGYGSGPSSDEIEVCLFGPGYGEAIAVHLGEGKWITVDSCIEPSTKTPAILHYFQEIGVSLGDVQTIIASHWHDD